MDTCAWDNPDATPPADLRAATEEVRAGDDRPPPDLNRIADDVVAWAAKIRGRPNETVIVTLPPPLQQHRQNLQVLIGLRDKDVLLAKVD